MTAEALKQPPPSSDPDATPAPHCHLEYDSDGIAWLHLDHAGRRVNTLSAAMLAALERNLAALETAPPRGLVIVSDKPGGFVAGADVNEFAGLDNPQDVRDPIRYCHHLFDQLAGLPYPTVALIHGHCLGGGLELALACRYRVVRQDPATVLGLPEVRLGIHPGFGGSVRLPALIGDAGALDLMLRGRTLDADRALALGLVDYALPERTFAKAARWLIQHDPGPHRAGHLKRLPAARPLRPLVARYLKHRLRQRARPDHYPAPYALIDLWARYGADPDRQPAAEAQSVANLVTGTTAQNLIRSFQLRERLKAGGSEGGFDVHHVHVIGAGAMGGDIAAWCALQGLNVSLQDQSAQHIAPAVARAHTLFRQRLREPRRVTAALDRLLPDPSGNALPRADLVIEAVSEDLELKRRLFAAIEPRLRTGAILTTNTSSIPLEELSCALDDPGRLVGLHFFNPVAKMQLVEVVHGEATRQTTATAAAAFAARIDRLPLPVASAPGFLVNRVLTPYLLEAVTLIEEGVESAAIDDAATVFGMPMGPVALADAVGLDICLAVADMLTKQVDGAVPDILRRHVAAGHLGRKTGRGFYRYRHSRPVRGWRLHRPAAPSDLQDRLILRLLNEAVRCLRDGIVSDAELLDAGLIYGTGFAPFRGGPIHYIHHAGAETLRERLAMLAGRHGSRFQPDPGWTTLSLSADGR